MKLAVLITTTVTAAILPFAANALDIRCGDGTSLTSSPHSIVSYIDGVAVKPRGRFLKDAEGHLYQLQPEMDNGYMIIVYEGDST